MDGSAKLTIFTEGNHFPVLLPLLFNSFPAWCRRTGDCQIDPTEILVVTLPQPMVVEMLLKGGVRLGNAIIPIGRDERVFPDFDMAGAEPLRRLAAGAVVEVHAVIFAHHRGTALLVRRNTPGIQHLNGFAAGVPRIVLASESEPGARAQYIATLRSLIGVEATSNLLSREQSDFPGRMGIQHRDVPYALLNNLADGGILFSHLADFYARSYPDQLRSIPVPGATAFGQDIAIARVIRKRHPTADAFLRFFLEAAHDAYPQGGFAPASSFAYGLTLTMDRPF